MNFTFSEVLFGTQIAQILGEMPLTYACLYGDQETKSLCYIQKLD